jgi:hypothetical protein
MYDVVLHPDVQDFYATADKALDDEAMTVFVDLIARL